MLMQLVSSYSNATGDSPGSYLKDIDNSLPLLSVSGFV